MPVDRFSFDVRLEYQDIEKSFNVITGENGMLLWQEGLVPALVQQQNTGGLTKDALPADLSALIAFENWSGGAGAVTADPGDSAPTRYSYSRHVDASWGDRLYKSPARNALTGITGTVVKFYTSPTWGQYAVVASTALGTETAGRYIYQMSVGEWVQRYDAASDIITDLLEWANSVDEYLVAARGDSNDIVYSTDGFATAPSTSTGNAYTFLAVRGNTALNPLLHGIKSTGAIAAATLIGTFTASDQIGSKGERVNGVEVADNVIVILKAEGVYTYNGSAIAQKFQANTLYRATNGRAHCTFLNKVLFNFDNRLVMYDPVQDDFETVYFPEHPELNGDITAAAGTTTHVYFTITNSAGNVYVMKGNPGVGAWHSWAYRSTNVVRSIHLQSQGNAHATNDVVVTDGGGGTGYFILSQDGLRPEDDTAYRYETSDGFLIGCLSDAGVFSMVKRLNGVRNITEATSAAFYVSTSYMVDTSMATPVLALTSEEAGLSTARVEEDTPFTRLTYKVAMVSPTNETAPRVLSVVFDTTPYPTRRRRINFTVEVEWRPGKETGVKRADSFTAMRAFLFALVDQQVTLYDPFGSVFIGKVQSVQGLGYRQKITAPTSRGAYGLYQVVFDEIAETTPGAAELTWDDGDWDDVRSWGD